MCKHPIHGFRTFAETTKKCRTSGRKLNKARASFSRWLAENRCVLCRIGWRHIIMAYIHVYWYHMWRFLKWGYPKMDGSYWRILWKWMIRGYPYFRKPPMSGHNWGPRLISFAKESWVSSWEATLGIEGTFNILMHFWLCSCVFQTD